MTQGQVTGSQRRLAGRRGPVASRPARLRDAAARPWARELTVLAGFLAAGVAVTWPLATYITGRLPFSRDVTIYVWNLWWVAHQIIHLHNPYTTTYMAAPAGLQLGYHTLVPLVGVVMTPVTLAFGPSAAYNLLTIIAPGLACYAMYRAARLWLPTLAGAIAAGAFFGLSSMLTYQAWYHLNIVYGTVLLPVTLEAAVRLRRDPAVGRAVILGVVLGASVLVNQESAVMALILAALVLIGWLIGSRSLHTVLDRTGILAAAGVTGLVVASPQLIAMFQQARAGGASAAAASFYYQAWVASVPSQFAPSPRLANFGLTGLAHIYTSGTHIETMNTFGVVLSALAVLGLIVSWRRRQARSLAWLWLGGAALALGPVLYIGRHMYVPLAQTWKGVQVSAVMPYTWFIRVPGLSVFREADRLALLGLVGAALLAGAGVDWLARGIRGDGSLPRGAWGDGSLPRGAWGDGSLPRGAWGDGSLPRGAWGDGSPQKEKDKQKEKRGGQGGCPPGLARPLIVVVALLGALEAGWSGSPGGPPTMPTVMAALDRPIAADHSGSIVVDVPFGLANIPSYGDEPAAQAMLMATADGHPRAVAYASWIPRPTIAAFLRHPFYVQLNQAQQGLVVGPKQITAARKDLRTLDVGWVVVWLPKPGAAVTHYLSATGFTFAYRADGAWLYRPAHQAGT